MPNKAQKKIKYNLKQCFDLSLGLLKCVKFKGDEANISGQASKTN